MNERRLNSLTLLLAAFLTMAAAAGCVDPIEIMTPEATADVELSFRISLPPSTLMTKAENDKTIPASEAEQTIYDLQIWAFTNNGADTEVAVGYAQKQPESTNPNISDGGGTTPTGWTDPSAIEITMKLPSSVVNSDNPKLDFYVLANGSSVGFPANDFPSKDNVKKAKRGDLKNNAFITGSDATGFGTACVSAVPVEGLPLTGCSCSGFDVTFLRYGFTAEQVAYIKAQNGQTLPEANPKDSQNKDIFSKVQWEQKTLFSTNGKYDYAKVCPTIELKRSIAKIHFVFAKSTNMSGTVTQITSIDLVNEKTAATQTTEAEYEAMLPEKTFLFSREDGSFALPPLASGQTERTYEAVSFKGENDGVLVDSDDILQVDSPLLLRNDGATPMSPQAYESFLTTNIGDKTTTQKTLYLRESDKTALRCKINYKIGDKVGVAYLPIPDGEKLYRNTWWTVYAYFMSYELGFQVSVLPWDGLGSSSNEHSHLQ